MKTILWRNKERIRKTIHVKYARQQHHKLMEKIVNLTPPELLLSIQEFYEQKWDEISKTRFPKDSKKAFQLIQQITKYNQYEKREGGLLSCYKDETGHIITEPEKIHENDIKYLESIQGRLSDRTDAPDANLQEVTEAELDKIVARKSSNKANPRPIP